MKNKTAVILCGGSGTRLGLLVKLPSCFFVGMRLEHIDPKTCQVSIPTT